MAVVNHNDILRAIRDRVEAAPAGTLLRHKWQHKEVDPKLGPYAEIILSPNQTDLATIGSDELTGFILVNVYVGIDEGADYPAEEAQKYLDLFPRGLSFGPGVEIYKTGTILNPIQSRNREGWFYTPLRIPYRVLSC